MNSDKILNCVLTSYHKLNGERLVFFNILYFISYYLPILFIGYSLIVTKIHLITHVCYLLTAYAVDEIIYRQGHLFLHSMFIELPKNDFIKQSPFFLCNYLHHYYNTNIFYKLPLRTLLYGGIESITATNILFIKKNNVSLLMYLYICSIIVSINFALDINLILLVNIYFFYNLGLARIYLFNLIVLISKDVVGINNAFLYVSYSLYIAYLKILTHIWYHVPNHKRLTHFGIITYHFMRFLEYINFISTAKHINHHSHSVNNIENAEEWGIFWTPNMINVHSESVWKKMVSVYVPNKREMKSYINSYKVYVKFIIFSSLFISTLTSNIFIKVFQI